jgi:hypothetical protein
LEAKLLAWELGEPEMESGKHNGKDQPSQGAGHGEAGKMFVSGFVTGFGLCAAIGVGFLMPRLVAKLGQRQEKAFRDSRSNYTNVGEDFGEIPGVIHESSAAIKDAVESLGKTFNEGREILDSVSGAINKLRE